MAEEQPVVLPRRRQPGDVQRHQGRLGGQRHEPGQRLRRPRDPDAVQDEQLGRRGRLPVEQGDVRACAGTTASSTTTTRRCSGPTRTSASEPARHDATCAPDNTFNKFTLSGNYRDLPWRSVISARYTWAKTTSDVALGADRAQHRRRSTPPTLPSEGNFNGENINQSFALAWTATPVANVDTRVYYYWTKLREQLRPGRVRQRADHAARERPRLRQLYAGQRHPDARSSATATTSSTTTPRTTSASTCGGSSRAASGWASAGTTTTSTRRASTTTSRTGTSCGSSTRTRCSTRCPAGSSTSTSSATRRSTSATTGVERREQPELPAAVHVGVRPAEQHDQPGQALPRLEPDGERRACRSRASGPRSTTTT